APLSAAGITVNSPVSTIRLAAASCPGIASSTLADSQEPNGATTSAGCSGCPIHDPPNGATTGDRSGNTPRSPRCSASSGASSWVRSSARSSVLVTTVMATDYPAAPVQNARPPGSGGRPSRTARSPAGRRVTGAERPASGELHQVGVEVHTVLPARGAAELVLVAAPGDVLDLAGKLALHQQDQLHRGAVGAGTQIRVVPVLGGGEERGRHRQRAQVGEEGAHLLIHDQGVPGGAGRGRQDHR